ncbi:unnamed protein product [Closterium sp. NIES-64]|nr:unnamed protein product [Closterium sp. NIES-64]
MLVLKYHPVSAAPQVPPLLLLKCHPESAAPHVPPRECCFSVLLLKYHPVTAAPQVPPLLLLKCHPVSAAPQVPPRECCSSSTTPSVLPLKYHPVSAAPQVPPPPPTPPHSGIQRSARRSPHMQFTSLHHQTPPSCTPLLSFPFPLPPSALPLPPSPFRLTPSPFPLPPYPFPLPPPALPLPPSSFRLTPPPFRLTPSPLPLPPSSFRLTPPPFRLTPSPFPLPPYPSPLPPFALPLPPSLPHLQESGTQLAMGLTCDSPPCNVREGRVAGTGGSKLSVEAASRPVIHACIFSPHVCSHPSQASVPTHMTLTPLSDSSGSESSVPTRMAITALPENTSSELRVEATDRPGLLMEIVDVLTGMSISVTSKEIDTEGVVAKDVFTVSYHGGPLDDEMTTLTLNALNHTLSRPDIKAEESY